MKIADAKNIPIQSLTEELGGIYSHTTRNGELWYHSPFRPDEKTASFKINPKLNSWHDFGLANTFAHTKQGSGGDIIDLWCDYHLKDRRSGIKEALAALEKLSQFSLRGGQLQQRYSAVKQVVQNPLPRYKIVRINQRISFQGLKEELHRRKISIKLANDFLKQGEILDTETNKKYVGFLFENDKGGYEVSIPNPQRQECFKTCIGPKASTRILVNDDRNSADIFEGFWDMLSWLELRKISRPQNHTYVLNSTSLVAETCQKIINFRDNIEYVFLFMDNDEAGYQATHAIAGMLTDNDIKVGSWEQLYEGYKDLNEFWGTNRLLVN